MPFDTAPKISSAHQMGRDSKARMPGPRADVNEGARHLEDITKAETSSLGELQSIEPLGDELEEDASEEDKLRRPAIKETAQSYGARGGLAHATRQTNLMLRERADKLDQIYDFRKVMIRGPDNSVVMPPVISDAEDTYELSDAGKTVRVADTVYEIISQARFSPVPPMWHSYLLREYSTPKRPPDEILPRTDGEREIWEHHVEEGWKAGVKQANEIFQADLNELDRDYSGMLKFTELLAEGKVSAPVVSKAPMGVTGTGAGMRVNDRAIRITRDPQLQTDSSLWVPTITNGSAGEYARPNDEDSEIHDYPNDADRQY
ncbi:DotC protein [Salipiger mucosus DSM 16094]|uniref:DotC protein n=2 Tax=Salipiger mucosus TaxID=263378 RepID=S9RIY1_9RHOB|nr:DotC protein [Salipiger mucosus DSM 16094]